MITSVFAPVLTFNIPKMFNMRKYPENIVEFGFVDQCDTGPREKHNQSLKYAFEFTNRQSQGQTEQVTLKHQQVTDLHIYALHVAPTSANFLVHCRLKSCLRQLSHYAGGQAAETH